MGPRFPPPGGQQVGYRDAERPSDPDAPRPPELEGPELPRGKRVVATRPDDPEVALAKAYYPPKRPRVAQASRAGVVVVLILVITWIALQVATTVSPRRHPVSPPARATQPTKL